MKPSGLLRGAHGDEGAFGVLLSAKCSSDDFNAAAGFCDDPAFTDGSRSVEADGHAPRGIGAAHLGNSGFMTFSLLTYVR